MISGWISTQKVFLNLFLKSKVLRHRRLRPTCRPLHGLLPRSPGVDWFLEGHLQTERWRYRKCSKTKIASFKKYIFAFFSWNFDVVFKILILYDTDDLGIVSHVAFVSHDDKWRILTILFQFLIPETSTFKRKWLKLMFQVIAKMIDFD